MPLSSISSLASVRSPETPPWAGARTFAGVYEENFAFVWRNVRRLGVADAALDDVVQEVFLVVHRKLAEFEGRSTLRTWLFAIILRTVRDHWRSHRRKRLELATPADEIALELVREPEERGPHAAASQAEAVRRLHELLAALDDDKREIFVLAELEQLSVVEIAELLEVNLNTAYARLRAARGAFEAALARQRATDTFLEVSMRDRTAARDERTNDAPLCSATRLR